MQGEATLNRRLVTLTGKDVLTFLQGLVTNDMRPLGHGPGLVWTALLSPQGKYLADFFVVNTGDTLLLDLPETLADATLRRLTMYRLRADVKMSLSPLHITRGLGDAPPNALADPRHPALGWRRYSDFTGSAAVIDWDAIRVAHLIPEAGRELIPDESYILEQGFERLHGVDFRKGCYVGQEVTARMKHKTDLRKGLARVQITGDAAEGSEITSDDKPVGILCTRSGNNALAYLRFDRALGDMSAFPAKLRKVD